MAFINLKKAFDTVQYQKIWISLEERRECRKLVGAIKSLLNDQKLCNMQGHEVNRI